MRFGLITLLAGLLLMGCGDTAKEDDSEPEPTPANATIANRRLATLAIDDYMTALKSALMQAINDSGAAGAISICRHLAPQLAEAVQEESGVVIRRVSERNRNPANAATPKEVDVLSRFADTSDLGPSFFELWEQGADGKTYTYYKPIRVGALCLKCHGPADEIEPAIVTALKENYPGDRATGYQIGDLRGMFVVEITSPPVSQD